MVTAQYPPMNLILGNFPEYLEMGFAKDLGHAKYLK